MSFILGQKRCGIVFDLDNTLVPTSKCYHFAIQAAKEFCVENFQLSKEMSDSIIEKYHNLSIFEQPFYKQNNLSFLEWRESMFKKALEEFTSIEDFSALHKHFHKSIMKDLVISEDAKSLLKELRNTYKLAILTNGDSGNQWEKIKRCEAESFVDAVVISGDHKMCKPDPRIFHLVCCKLGLENRQCIMVGDLLSTDILGSQNAGFKGSILVEGRDIDRLNEIKPDHVISDVVQIKDILKKFKFS